MMVDLKAFLTTEDPFAVWLMFMSDTWYDMGNYGDGLACIDKKEAEWLAGKVRELFRTEDTVQEMGMR